MELIVKLNRVLPIQSGTSNNGPWKKQDLILEYELEGVETPVGRTPSISKKICVSLWGDKIEKVKLEIGRIYHLSFELESREFNGKWYTDIKAHSIDEIKEIHTVNS